MSNVKWGTTTIGTLVDSTRVEVEVTGILSRYWADNDLVTFEYRGDYIGPWDAKGTYTLGYNSIVVRSDLPYGGVAFAEGPLGPTSPPMKAVTARGGVTVEWTKKPPLQSTGNCDQVGGDPCHTFTGTFTVKVTPASQYLTLTPSPSSVLTGDSVTFTPNAGGKAYTVWSWTWVPNDGSASLTVCGTANRIRTVSVSI